MTLEELEAIATGDHQWACTDCGHLHAPLRMGGICIGCPCKRTTPDLRKVFLGKIVPFSGATRTPEPKEAK